MNCSCLHRERGIVKRWSVQNKMGNSFCSKHIYEHRVNSLIHRDMSKTLNVLLLLSHVCRHLCVIDYDKFQCLWRMQCVFRSLLKTLFNSNIVIYMLWVSIMTLLYHTSYFRDNVTELKSRFTHILYYLQTDFSSNSQFKFFN